MRYLNVGFGSMLAADRIVSILSPDSAPVRRLVQDAKDDGRAIDLTTGKKTRAVILTDTEHVFLSAIQVSTLVSRLESDSGDVLADDSEQ